MRTSARHSSRFSPRSPTETTSTALMLRSVACASARAALTASSELVVELPTSSMIFVTAIYESPEAPTSSGSRHVVLRLVAERRRRFAGRRASPKATSAPTI